MNVFLETLNNETLPLADGLNSSPAQTRQTA
jgi:hypothetical protein